MNRQRIVSDSSSSSETELQHNTSSDEDPVNGDDFAGECPTCKKVHELKIITELVSDLTLFFRYYFIKKDYINHICRRRSKKFHTYEEHSYASKKNTSFATTLVLFFLNNLFTTNFWIS